MLTVSLRAPGLVSLRAPGPASLRAPGCVSEGSRLWLYLWGLVALTM